MDITKRLEELGVQCVGGTLIKGHTDIGQVRNGHIQLTPEGEALLSVEDAVVKPKVEKLDPPAPAAKTGKKKTQAQAPADPPAPATDNTSSAESTSDAPDMTSLDNLIGE